MKFCLLAIFTTSFTNKLIAIYKSFSEFLNFIQFFKKNLYLCMHTVDFTQINCYQCLLKFFIQSHCIHNSLKKKCFPIKGFGRLRRALANVTGADLDAAATEAALDHMKQFAVRL